MPKTLFASLLWFFAGILITSSAAAQSEADSASNGHKLYAHIEDNFYNAIGLQSRLYNGEKYGFYSPQIKGNAYLMDNDQWNKGNILYDGFWYKNVDMLYDLYKDVVVISLYKNFFKLSLINEKVNCFDVLGHHFIYIKANSSVINPLQAGYYDQLYCGKIQVLCKRSKSIQETHSLSGSIDSYFLSSTDYYIYKNGKYFTVNSKGAFLDALKDKKKDIQQFMSANKLKIKKDTKELAMVKIAAYYDQLTN
jgi:hypothetical protein